MPTNTLSFNPYIDAVMGGDRLGKTNLTYHFAKEVADSGAGRDERLKITPLDEGGKQSFVKALAAYSAVCKLTFTYSDDKGDVNGSYREMTQSGLGGGTGMYISDKFIDSPILPGSTTYFVMLHELGHVLGLRHTGELSGLGGRMPLDQYAHNYSVMGGSGVIGGEIDENWSIQTLAINDIRALQYMYGANFNNQAGDTTYKWNKETGEESINGAGTGAPQNKSIVS